jgi:hypothetical protein
MTRLWFLGVFKGRASLPRLLQGLGQALPRIPAVIHCGVRSGLRN